MARQIVVEIVGDASRFNAATKGAITSAGTLSDRLKNVGKGVAVGAGIGAFNLLTGAISGAVGMMGEMRTAFQEDAASQAKLVTALQANAAGWDGQTAAIERVIAAQMRLGFSDDEQRSSLAELSGITKDLTDAQNLQSLAMDLARFKNMDLGAASDLVGKVYGGNLGILSRYGIILEEGATATEALAAIQKMAAGQAEAYADTSLGKEAAAHLKVQEAMEKVGGVIDRVATVLIPIAADAITTLVDGFSDFWDATEPIRTKLQPIFELVFGAIGRVIGGAFEAVGRVIDAIKTAIGLAQDLAEWVTTPLNPTVRGPGVVGGRGGGAVPGFAEGGIVPGRPGAPMLAMVHGGERITPVGQVGSGLNVTINVNGTTDLDATARAVMQAFKREVDRQGMSFA